MALEILTGHLHPYAMPSETQAPSELWPWWFAQVPRPLFIRLENSGHPCRWRKEEMREGRMSESSHHPDGGGEEEPVKLTNQGQSLS